jgi:hypothetical protein
MIKNNSLAADPPKTERREHLKSQMRDLQASLWSVQAELEAIAKQLRPPTNRADHGGRQTGDKPRLAEALRQAVLLLG